MTIDECTDCGKTYPRRYLTGSSPFGRVILHQCEDCEELALSKHEPDYDAPSAEDARIEALDIYLRLK